MHKDNCIGPLPGGPLGQKPAWVLGIAHSELPQIRSTSVTVQLSVELAYVVAIVVHDHKWLSPLHPHCTSPSLQRDEGAVAILTLRSLIPSSWWGEASPTLAAVVIAVRVVGVGVWGYHQKGQPS